MTDAHRLEPRGAFSRARWRASLLPVPLLAFFAAFLLASAAPGAWTRTDVRRGVCDDVSSTSATPFLHAGVLRQTGEGQRAPGHAGTPGQTSAAPESTDHGQAHPASRRTPACAATPHAAPAAVRGYDATAPPALLN